MWEERGGEGCSWREKGIHIEMVGMEGGICGMWDVVCMGERVMEISLVVCIEGEERCI